ncbi:MAG: YbaB/EbfC family nucleoid-associated protein [Acidobacteria bacterium]|nr:YbaB/EbfC family nucleoid-associated protein [Acidobacteriota bacterium]
MDFKDLMEQAQQMKGQMAAAMDRVEVEGESGGGLVRVRLNGRREAVTLKIDPDALKDNDLDFLQDLILAAFNNASRKLEEIMVSRMGSMLSNLKLE